MLDRMQLAFSRRLLVVLPEYVPAGVVSILLDLLLQLRILQHRLEVTLVIQIFGELFVLSVGCRSSTLESGYRFVHGVRGKLIRRGVSEEAIGVRLTHGGFFGDPRSVNRCLGPIVGSYAWRL